ncbi:hypothetical protein CLOM_g600 [Closterium sp. NIES-68]|nr:hypothetical protein CLOM_g600 [Closterium sp. NIES-68]GJP59777.1 hypothetical protein CLOP_g15142 [Closterium sp. NIES-67]GJP86430.1 hypothetical protein CLOP_g16454 [Closterium sp. NIES-67]
MSSFSRLHDKVVSQQQKQQHYRDHVLGLNAFQRHQKFVNDYVRFYGRSASSSAAPSFKTDLDVLRESYRFIRSEADDADGTWEQRLAKRYYDKLFKEYCVADMSRYKENKIGLRWRAHAEVLQGKGQFVCGTKGCDNREGLHSYEVNFAYHEAGQKKQALVKLRVCAKHAYQLNYRKEKELEKKREAEQREREREERRRAEDRKHKERKKRKKRSRGSSSDSRHSSSSSETTDSSGGSSRERRAESESGEDDSASRCKNRRRNTAREERHSASDRERDGAKPGKEKQEGKKLPGSERDNPRAYEHERGGASGAGEGTEAARDGGRCGEAGTGESAGDGRGSATTPGRGGAGQTLGSGCGLAAGVESRNVVVQGGTLPASEDVWQQPAVTVEPSREEEFDEYFQGMFL